MNPYEMQWSSATPGLLIILLDQSGSMTNKYDDNMTKSEFASKAVNRVINTLIQRNFDGESPKNRAFISVIGYDNYVHELCSGYLKDLDAKPIRIDEVMKKQSDGAGGLVEIPYKMPVWVEPITKDGATNMKGAFEMAKAIIEKWMTDKPGHPAPVVINISDGAPYYDSVTLSIFDNSVEVILGLISICLRISCSRFAFPLSDFSRFSPTFSPTLFKDVGSVFPEPCPQTALGTTSLSCSARQRTPCCLRESQERLFRVSFPEVGLRKYSAEE